MYGSSASKEYGKGGTVNAMGESSGVKFLLDFSRPSAASKLTANFSAPSRAAPAMLPATSKFLRFTKNFPAARADVMLTNYTSRRFPHSTPAGRKSGEFSVSLSLDARERPAGRFSDYGVAAPRQPLQRPGNLSIPVRIRLHAVIAKGNASITHQALPFCSLDWTASKQFAKLLLRQTRDPQQVRQEQSLLTGCAIECCERARLKLRQPSSRRFPVPGANILADIAAKNVPTHGRAKLLRNRSAELNRQIRDAAA